MVDPTIFVVDDDAAVGDAAKAVLESAGYRTKLYPSANAFLEDYDPALTGCLLLDIRMPGLTGLELQRRLNADGIRLPVILMTGHGDIHMAVSTMKAGAIDFLEKPCRDGELLDAIRRGLEYGAQGGRGQGKPANGVSLLAVLTPREREVFDLLVEGHPNKGVARVLGISPRTVEIHRAHITKKLRSRSLAELVRISLAG